MFRDHLPTVMQQATVTKLLQSILQQGRLIGRVEKDRVKLSSLPLQVGQGAQHIPAAHRGLLMQTAVPEIVLDQSAGRLMGLDKSRQACSTAQGLQPHGSATGEEIEDSSAGNTLTED